MKLLLKFVTCILLTGIIINFSCQKELSCEGCIGKNKPPIAIAGTDQVITLPTDSILLDGKSSSDPDGTISNWLWTKISGPASFNTIKPNDSITLVKNLRTGAYQFELKVTDKGGLFSKDTVQVIVNDPSIPNRPPIANAGADKTITLPINTATLDGSASTDPDNNISGYAWIKISGPASFNTIKPNDSITLVKNLTTGTYLFELKVTDNGGLFSKDTMQVMVNDATQPNRPPIANAGADQTITLPVNTATLDGSASTDPDNSISGYAWTKISGPTSFNIANPNAVQTQVTNLIEGIYQFELKVTDADGLFSNDTLYVLLVKPPAPCTDCKIVFASDRDGNTEIYSCNIDGSNIRRLTNNAGTDDQPAWSPDGSKIAFTSDRSGIHELYIMNRDGSNPVRKTFSGSYSGHPAWSPDGTKIVYSSGVGIWVVGAIIGLPSLLFEDPGQNFQPTWSPDGTKIAWVSDWAAYDFVYDIYTINADGSGFTALTGNIFDFINYLSPSWSPSGTKLAMAVQQRPDNYQYNTQVGIMNPDGNGIKVIRSGAARWTRTSWSGDGTRIAYTSLSGSRNDISWVSSDGTAWGTIVTSGWNADWQR